MPVLTIPIPSSIANTGRNYAVSLGGKHGLSFGSHADALAWAAEVVGDDDPTDGLQSLTMRRFAAALAIYASKRPALRGKTLKITVTIE